MLWEMVSRTPGPAGSTMPVASCDEATCWGARPHQAIGAEPARGVGGQRRAAIRARSFRFHGKVLPGFPMTPRRRPLHIRTGNRPRGHTNPRGFIDTPRGSPPPEAPPLVPTVPRGNAVCDAPRRPTGIASQRTPSVPDGIPTQSVGTSLSPLLSPGYHESPVVFGKESRFIERGLRTGPGPRLRLRPGRPPCGRSPRGGSRRTVFLGARRPS